MLDISICSCSLCWLKSPLALSGKIFLSTKVAHGARSVKGLMLFLSEETIIQCAWDGTAMSMLAQLRRLHVCRQGPVPTYCACVQTACATMAKVQYQHGIYSTDCCIFKSCRRFNIHVQYSLLYFTACILLGSTLRYKHDDNVNSRLLVEVYLQQIIAVFNYYELFCSCLLVVEIYSVKYDGGI